MKYDYDKIRYLELLKQAKSLEKKGMSLYDEDRERFLELLDYQVRLSSQKSWENRKDYFSVMKNFLNEKLTAEDFVDDFLCLWRKDRDRPTVNCDPDIESKGFSRWINKIFIRCEDFDDEAEENEEYNEKWLKNEVSNLLIQIQKEYNSNENID